MTNDELKHTRMIRQRPNNQAAFKSPIVHRKWIYFTSAFAVNRSSESHTAQYFSIRQFVIRN